MHKARGWLATVSLASSLLFAGILVVLHVLRSDLDPSWRFISEYEIGSHGWLMRWAFAIWAISLLSLGGSILPDCRGVIGWLGLLQLTISSAGMVLAAIFVPDKENKLHEVGAMLDCVPFAAIFLNAHLYRRPAWARARLMLLVTALLPLIGLVVFMGSLAMMLPNNGGQPGPNVLAGWPNRFFVAMHLAWSIPLAWHSLRLARETKPG